MALESWVLSHQVFTSSSRLFYPAHENRRKSLPIKVLGRNTRYPFPFVPNCVAPSTFARLQASSFGADAKLLDRTKLRCLGSSSDCLSDRNAVSKANLNFIQELLKRGIILAATVCGVLVFGCSRVFAVEGVANAGYGVFGQSILLLTNTWPKVLQVLRIFKEQGLVLAVLLGLSAFFSMAETSITTLWPWKVSIYLVYVILLFLNDNLCYMKVGAMPRKQKLFFVPPLFSIGLLNNYMGADQNIVASLDWMVTLLTAKFVLISNC